MHQCSIIVKSRCGAPTFDIDTASSVSEASWTPAELWSVSYMEYSQGAPGVDTPPKDLVLKPEDLTLDQSHYKGGMLYDVSVWYQGNAASKFHSMLTPARVVLDWMAPYITDIGAYNDYVKEGGSYQLRTLFWNTQYAKNATRDYYTAVSGEGEEKTSIYSGPSDAFLNATIPWRYNEAGERYYSAEKPFVEAPLPYEGPQYSASVENNRFTITSGYGQPTSGLWIPGKGGKSFGVRGQGNKVMGLDKKEVPLSDQAYSLRWPVQPAESDKCTPSYIALTVGWTEANTGSLNKLAIEFRDSKWRSDVDFTAVPTPSVAPPVFEREGLATQLSFSVLAVTAAVSVLFS